MPAPQDRIDTFTAAIQQLGVLYTRIAAERGAKHDTFGKQELLAVGVLSRRGSARMGEMAESLGISQSAVTPLIDRLEAAGLVRRVRSQTDRRVWLTELTEAGRDVAESETATYRQAAAEMLAPLSEEEQVALVALLGKIGAAASR